MPVIPHFPWDNLNSEIHSEALAVRFGKSRVSSASVSGGNRKFSSSSPQFFRGSSSPKYPCHIVSTTGDSAIENVALTHTPVRSAEGHTLRNNVTLGKPKHHQNQVTTKIRMQEKPQTTTSLLMESIITTPIKAYRLDYWLKGYDGEKRKFLVEGFTVGFRILFTGQRSCRLSGNATSVSKNLDILKQKIQIEIDNYRVAGPFKVIPFQNFQSSPLGLVPKYSRETIADYRVIHNLSFLEGTSVNDGIQEEFKSVQYQDIEDAVALMRKYGKNCGLFKLDIQNAYKIVPIHY